MKLIVTIEVKNKSENKKKNSMSAPDFWLWKSSGSYLLSSFTPHHRNIFSMEAIIRHSSNYNVADIRTLLCPGNLPATDATYLQ